MAVIMVITITASSRRLWRIWAGVGIGSAVLGYGLGSYFGGRAGYYGYPGGYAPGYGLRGRVWGRVWLWGGYGYGAGYGYAPAVAVPVAPPPVYIQRQEVVQVQPQAQAANYWHYCRNPEGYYPYVKNCPGGWLQVAPQPAQYQY